MAKKVKTKKGPGGKRHRANFSERPERPVTASEAIAVLKKFKVTKFDQTVDCVMALGIDPKQADQAIRGSVALPAGIGKSKRVIAFCPPEKVDEAKVVFVGNDVNDLPGFRVAGWSVAVSDALPEVVREADYILSKPGGHGAVRELCDLILNAIKT